MHLHPIRIRSARSPSSASACVHSIATSRLFYFPDSSAVRAPSSHRPTQPPAPPSSPVSFPVPSYLNHSSLRHLLQTDVSPILTARRRHYSPSTDSDDESNASPPPREVDSTPSLDHPLQLPTRWDPETCHHHLSISDNGRELTFQSVATGSESNAAAARTVQPIPPACGIYYYEVKIHSKGQKAFAGPDVRSSRLPGWEPNSWGYHGDDGCSFATEKKGTPYGPTFGLDDVIGCGIDFTTHRAFYTRNGVLLGPVFENVGKGIDLYPSVGLQHTGESVRVNFGHEPFKFDIADHVAQQRNAIWNSIINSPLNPSIFSGGDVSGPLTNISDEQTKLTINKLVLSYLAHHGYVRTARTFQKQIHDTVRPISEVPASGDVEMADASSSLSKAPLEFDFEKDIAVRTRIVDSVLSGDIDTALSETERYHPSVLEAEQSLMLAKLRCRKFVEMILESAEMKRKMTGSAVGSSGSFIDDTTLEGDGMDMDVDDEIPSMNGTTNGSDMSESPIRRPSTSSPKAQYQLALQSAIQYGQALDRDYRKDERPEVRSIFKKSFSVLAFYDPLEAGGITAEVAGHDARIELANELNQAILKSQGRPTRPTLETVYRHTSVSIHYLGLTGIGSAAFADMQKEFLDG
ncbi:SPRY-domain-containing protein [Dendrothele bispora CBS 962.96]|uniref:SPRY-domain-containing protein n=1 Tax=Dendrothele bispora (strain CBS 962.96) TaxID=1314807 RepID=A0A4S8LNP4_DENBC|nr:SPRY-domain-containing protein [Dendrothele bispora CBS 962.96]